MTELRRAANRLRHPIWPLLDAAAWTLSLAFATYLRFGLHVDLIPGWHLLVAIAVAVVVQSATGWPRLYRVRWKAGSFEQVSALVPPVATTGVVLVVVGLVFFRHDLPVGSVVAAGAFTLLLTAGGRIGWRYLQQNTATAPDTAERVIVFGAGEGGRQLINALVGAGSVPMHPVALLDDDPAKGTTQIRHLRVEGDRDAIGATARRLGATGLVIAIPSAGSDLIREIAARAEEAGLTVRALPPVAQLFALRVNIADVRPVTEADLLGRRTIDTNMESIAQYLTGRRVLVTGAGGSIGSELCRQVHQFEPAALIMLDRDESGLHQVQLSIEGRAMLDQRHLVVCDIRDPEALRAVFAEHRPDVVFHAAALKHLPLLEMWPTEAVKTNVWGTMHLLTISEEFGVARFVNISTDKAAAPISVLGYTKRLAERLTATIGAQASGEYISVRFGNVLGSSGSFLTAFRSQIEAGGPVTVTDPDVTRYFMTIPEAVQLVVQAGALGSSGRVLILEMGEPVRIAEVAAQLIAQSGGAIDIVYTGLRPGEKLHEQLFADDDANRVQLHPLIVSAEVPPIALAAATGVALNAGADTLKAALRDLSVSSEDLPATAD
ncbi:MAG TPA: nucleoside-diphosphate sugar epimerase/dehydratase [Acidimicrobiales bacterium]|nr:nucleoside-diphosphate sugar epimerase/dehydratase [Acidimicrobiales bacterium]